MKRKPNYPFKVTNKSHRLWNIKRTLFFKSILIYVDIIIKYLIFGQKDPSHTSKPYHINISYRHTM